MTAAVAVLLSMVGRRPRHAARELNNAATSTRPWIVNKNSPSMVIGAALPRTGTSSLSEALAILGFGATYNIMEMLEREELTDWDVQGADYSKANFPQVPNVVEILSAGNYHSGVDIPFCIFWREIWTSYTGSKVILTKRDPEKWYKSCVDTIAKTPGCIPFTDNRLPLLSRAAYTFVPPLRRLYDWGMKVTWDPWQFNDKTAAIAAYERYHEDVRASVPKDELLEFSVAEGWEPLCQFLGVPIPDGLPFPCLNDTATQIKNGRILQLVGLVICFLLVCLLGLVLWISQHYPIEAITAMTVMVGWIGWIIIYGFGY